MKNEDSIVTTDPATGRLVTYHFRQGELARMRRKAIFEAVLASAEIEGEGLPSEIANRIRGSL